MAQKSAGLRTHTLVGKGWLAQPPHSFWTLGGFYLTDPANGTDYVPVYQGPSDPLTAPLRNSMTTGEAYSAWIHLSAPPAATTARHRVIPRRLTQDRRCADHRCSLARSGLGLRPQLAGPVFPPDPAASLRRSAGNTCPPGTSLPGTGSREAALADSAVTKVLADR